MSTSSKPSAADIKADVLKMSTATRGSFNRGQTVYRNFITSSDGNFKPEKGRYHLYVSYACPWAHRTLITRKLKGLEDYIDVSIVSPRMGNQGWPFANVDSFPGATTDPVTGARHVMDVYLSVNPNYPGRTVPILFDKKTNTIVNNESSEIIRSFNNGFNEILPPDYAKVDMYPEHLREKIDEINEWIYATINNGVYRCGFSSTQEAYEEAVSILFKNLDRVEAILKDHEYLVGDQLTEADVRLFPTIIRFDPVYVGHFKTNIRTIRGGYPAIHKWVRKLYWLNPAFKDTTNFDHIKTHYYWSHTSINPLRIVPVGPVPHIEPL